LAYAGFNLNVRSATVTTPGSAQIQVSIPPQGQSWSNFVFRAYGNRQSGDSFTYNISNGAVSLTGLSPDITYSWTNGTAPTSLTILLNPASAATVKGTSISTFLIRYNMY
jgi:hypothetical protein